MTDNTATRPIDDQEIINAQVCLQNEVFRLLGSFVGMRGEPEDLEAGELQRRLDRHPERDFAANVHRVVGEMLASFGLTPS